MVLQEDKLCKGGRDAWMYIERPFCMAPGFRASISEALAHLGYLPSTQFLKNMLMSFFFLLPLVGADLGVHSDSDDQRLTIRITPLPADSGYPFSLHRQVQLQCDIDTEPAIDIGSCGWRFNYGDRFLMNNNKYTLYVHPSRGTVHSLTMILTINGITEDELGYYTCEGKNSAGLRKTSTVELAIVAEDTVGIRDAARGETMGTTNGFTGDYNDDDDSQLVGGTNNTGIPTVDPDEFGKSSAKLTDHHKLIKTKFCLCFICLLRVFLTE